MNKFHGTGTALVTPFDSQGNIDFDALERLLEFQIKGGVEYLVSLGTTGETATLSKEEKRDIWKFTREKVNGRLPLVAGIGGNNTAEVLKDLSGFDADGYDAILSVSPYYNKPNQEGIYQHYKAIGEVTPLPVLLYNVPGRTGMNMSAETTVRLANDFDAFIGIKDAAGNFDHFNKLLRDLPDDFLFISGDDPVALPLISMGAVGVISVISNALPAAFSTMVRSCLAANFAEAMPLHRSFLDLIDLLFVEGNPPGVKAALKELGICSDKVRLPLAKVSGETSEKIRKELSAFK